MEVQGEKKNCRSGKRESRIMSISHRTIILKLTLPLTILLVITSSTGIFMPDFYSNETLNWQEQSRGQDIIDLFLIAPSLLVTSILVFRNKSFAVPLWGGVILYLVYTFVIFCFDIHFNKMFILYCIILGVSFYSFMFFLVTQSGNDFPDEFKKKPVIKFTGIYFLVISSVFLILWLSEILPAVIDNSVPQSLSDAGLVTNPVHVIDLSVILPGIFITGILLLKKRNLGFILVPVLLTFLILMDITIGFLTIMISDVWFPLVVSMSLLALLCLVLLILIVKGETSLK